MSFHQNKPDEILKEERNDLHSAVKDAGHEYHLFTIATINDKVPEVFILILEVLSIAKSNQIPPYLHFFTVLKKELNYEFMVMQKFAKTKIF
jgi:hypothetical protein